VDFSGKVESEGIPYKKSQMKGFPETQTATAFRRAE
jgi:hypothetical protein